MKKQLFTSHNDNKAFLNKDTCPQTEFYKRQNISSLTVPPAGKHQCLHLDLVPVLLDVVSQNQQEDEEQRRKRKALVVYALRALTSLAEAPNGRRLLMERLPLLERRTQADEEDQEIRRAAQTAVRVITWTP